MNTHQIGKRVGYTTWAVDGPKGRVLVRRLSDQYWLVGHSNRPLLPNFFTRKFRIKSEAYKLAHDMVGAPYPDRLR